MLAVAWAGAALFLASLTGFGWFYLVALGRPVAPPAEGATAAVAINVALFSLFALHHSVFARAGVKRLVTRWLPAPLERAAYVWAASLLLLAVCALWRPVPGQAWRAEGVAALVLWSVQASGLALTVASAARIDVWELAGIRQAAAATGARRCKAGPDRADLGKAASLEVRGPYRWLRHPIYLGWVLFVFGTPSMTAGRLLMASVSTLYLVVAIPFEERSLAAEFGHAYRDYQRQVRWRLLPGLW